MTDIDHDAEIETEYEPGDHICRALWNTIDDLEERGFTRDQISKEWVWMASQLHQSVDQCPITAAKQVRYLQEMVDSLHREIARIDAIFGYDASEQVYDVLCHITTKLTKGENRELVRILGQLVEACAQVAEAEEKKQEATHY